MANHLKTSKSRYLLQHAENPVDWHPWSEEPFERAAAEGKPVLVSIGYSSCHWCHVMAHDCFEDEEIAGILNESFVAIKVDREELPDVDGFYMEFLTHLTGRGGWPLNVFVNPNRAPFYGTSYLPPLDFGELLRYVAAEYRREERLRTQTIDRRFAVGRLPAEQIRSRLAAIDPRSLPHDTGPQFPQAPYLLFALRRGEREMVRGELQHLVTKGLFDHIEGGWFRYSVDPEFKIPHFEKMLYDQATLLLLCAEARPLAPDLCDYALRGALGWLERHMRLPSGLFGSATDADTPEGEGFYYTLPDAHDSPSAERQRERGDGSDFEGGLLRLHECGVHERRFLPWIDLGLYAREPARSEQLLEAHRERRRERSLPALDEKAVVSWNCLLGYALLRAASATHDSAVESAAERLFRAIEPLSDEALPHALYGDTPLPGPRYLEDSAAALLFAAERARLSGGGRPEPLLAAIRARFVEGGYLFHTTERRFESLSLWQDSPFPSGGALLLSALLDLGEPDSQSLSRLAIAEVAADNPTFFGMWCGALDRAHGIAP